MTSYFHLKFIYLSNKKRIMEIYQLVFEWRSFEYRKVGF